MFPEALQFEFTRGDAPPAVILPHQMLCLRQTQSTLEFLHLTASGRSMVITVEGDNLGILRRDLLAGAVTTLKSGPVAPAWSQCRIQHIYTRYGWTLPKKHLAPDPNPIPKRFYQMETGIHRDIWMHDGLAFFAIARNPKQQQFLFQFQHGHSYVLSPVNGEFPAMLKQLRSDNFRVGTVNRFTVFPVNPYPALPGLCLRRYPFEKISYEEKNLAKKSEWTILISFRPDVTIHHSHEIL